MLRLAPTVFVAALLAVMFAAAAPAGAEMLLKLVTAKNYVVIGLNDTELKRLGGDANGIASWPISARRERPRFVGRVILAPKRCATLRPAVRTPA